MYKMVSEYGNAIMYAENEREKEQLLSVGFREEKVPKTVKKRASGGEQKKNGAENKDKSKGHMQ